MTRTVSRPHYSWRAFSLICGRALAAVIQPLTQCPRGKKKNAHCCNQRTLCSMRTRFRRSGSDTRGHYRARKEEEEVKSTHTPFWNCRTFKHSWKRIKILAAQTGEGRQVFFSRCCKRPTYKHCKRQTLLLPRHNSVLSVSWEGASFFFSFSFCASN